MRRSILLYWILTCGVVVGANQMIATNDGYRAKISVIDRLYDGLRRTLDGNDTSTLILGNSYVAVAVPSDLVPPHYARLIEHGMTLEHLATIIESLPDSSSIERVVVGLGYNYASPTRGGSDLYQRHYAPNAFEREWWSIPLVRGRSQAIVIVKNEITCFVANKNCTRKRNRTGGTADAADIQELEEAGVDRATEMRESIANRYRQYQPILRAVSPDFVELVSRMANACRKRGIELWGFTAPIHPGLRRRLDPQVLDDFAATVRDAGWHYVDFNTQTSDWGDAYFHDATHVSRKGGMEVMDALLKWVGNESQSANR